VHLAGISGRLEFQRPDHGFWHGGVFVGEGAMETELAELLEFTDSALDQQAEAEMRWVGCWVRLCEPIDPPSPNASHVLLDAGAVGQIVGLRLDRDAPFIVEFPDFPCRVAPRLERIELMGT
jgi:hypothetical protein